MFDFIAVPIGFVLGKLFELTSSYGFSIILITILIKLILFPISRAQVKSQKSMNEVQPKIQKLNEKYKNDKEKLAEETMKLYKEHNVNPLAGCLPMFIQLPIIFGLFAVIKEPATFVFNGSVELAAAATNQTFLWIKDMAAPDLLSAIINVDFASKAPGILPLLAGLFTYLQFLTMPKPPNSGNDSANQMMKSMQIFMPLFIIYSGMRFAAGITLYWAVSTAFQILQQMFMNRFTND